MTQPVKTLAAKSDDLSSIHRTYMVEGENKLLEVALGPSMRAFAHVHIHTIKKYNETLINIGLRIRVKRKQCSERNIK